MSFARVRLHIRHAFPISLLILRKKPTVLQSRKACTVRILSCSMLPLPLSYRSTVLYLFSLKLPFFLFLYFRDSIDEEDRMGGGRTTYTNNVALRYDGRCTWLNPAMFRSICSVDVTNFPFDDQECELKFGSWAFDRSKIDMTNNNDTDANRYYIKNGEWKMLNLSVKRNSLKYQCCPHEFTDVTITVKIRRESLDYILKLLIPCSLISSMIFLGFVLPPESGERIGLSITVLLAMTVFQQLSSELMPSYGFPLLGQFYFAIMLEIGASLAVTTLILNFYHRNRRRMPKTMRKVILCWLARIFFPCQKPKDWSEVRRQSNALRRNMDSIDVESKGRVSCSGSEESCGDDQLKCQTGKFPRYDERMHTWVVQDSGNKVDTISTNGPSNGFRSFCNLGASPAKNCKQNGGFKKEPKGLKDNRNFRGGAKKASKKKLPSNASIFTRQLTIDSMSAPFGGNVLDWTEEKLKNQKEWIKAARVLDRLFLILSIVITIVTLLTIFLRAPRFRLE